MFQSIGAIPAKAQSLYLEYIILGPFSVNAPPSFARQDN